MQQVAPLFDHLVGDGEQRLRYGEAERSGSFEVDDQLELGLLLNRQVGGLFALQDTADIDPDQTILICEAAAIAYKTASGGEITQRVNCRNLVMQRQRGELVDLIVEEDVLADQ